MVVWREKGLCFNCDAKFTIEHHYCPPQFLCLLTESKVCRSTKRGGHPRGNSLSSKYLWERKQNALYVFPSPTSIMGRQTLFLRFLPAFSQHPSHKFSFCTCFKRLFISSTISIHQLLISSFNQWPTIQSSTFDILLKMSYNFLRGDSSFYWSWLFNHCF